MSPRDPFTPPTLAPELDIRIPADEAPPAWPDEPAPFEPMAPRLRACLLSLLTLRGRPTEAADVLPPRPRVRRVA
jgi:hypothetical protein